MEKEPKYAGGYPVIEEIEFNIKSKFIMNFTLYLLLS